MTAEEILKSIDNAWKALGIGAVIGYGLCALLSANGRD